MKKTTFVYIVLALMVLGSLAFAKESRLVATYPESRTIHDISAIMRVDSGFTQNSDGSFGVLINVITSGSHRGAGKSWNLVFQTQEGMFVQQGDNLFFHQPGHDPLLVATHRWYYGKHWRPVDNVQIKVKKAVDFEESSFSVNLEY